jgi:FkbM family methyltransferase
VILQRLLLRAYRLAGARFLGSAAGRRLFVGAYFLYKRWIEDPFGALVRRNPELFRDGDVLDVGANVGYTAALFARVIDPGAKVHAFEPEGRNFEMLGELVARSGLAGRIVPIRAAVGAGEGSVRLWLNEAHHADHRVLTGALAAGLPEGQASHTEEVPLVSLDGYVARQRITRVCFVKIDVQGFEREVCRGMERVLDANPGVAVAVEYSPPAVREQGFAPEEILAFFDRRGRRPHLIGRGGRLQPAGREEIEGIAGQRGYVDVIYLPPL